MQTAITIAFAIATLGASIVAAALWLRSAMIETPEVEEPVPSISDVPEVHMQTAVVNLNNLRTAMGSSAKLNKKAAVWTGISALLSAATTVAGT